MPQADKNVVPVAAVLNSGKTCIEMIATPSLPAEPDNQSKSHALDAGFRKHDR